MDQKNPCYLPPKYSLSKLVEEGNQGESANPESPGNQPSTWRWYLKLAKGGIRKAVTVFHRPDTLPVTNIYIYMMNSGVQGSASVQ